MAIVIGCLNILKSYTEVMMNLNTDKNMIPIIKGSSGKLIPNPKPTFSKLTDRGTKKAPACRFSRHRRPLPPRVLL